MLSGRILNEVLQKERKMEGAREMARVLDVQE